MLPFSGQGACSVEDPSVSSCITSGRESRSIALVEVGTTALPPSEVLDRPELGQSIKHSKFDLALRTPAHQARRLHHCRAAGKHDPEFLIMEHGHGTCASWRDTFGPENEVARARANELRSMSKVCWDVARQGLLQLRVATLAATKLAGFCHFSRGSVGRIWAVSCHAHTSSVHNTPKQGFLTIATMLVQPSAALRKRISPRIQQTFIF